MIALVVTIVVLIILAGITIATLTGDGGLFGKSNQAKMETEIKQYQEKLDDIKTRTLSKDYQGNLDGFLDKLTERINKDSMFKDAQEVTPNYEKDYVLVITKEGYMFNVTMNETTYAGLKGEETDINKIVVSMEKTPTSWTDDKVRVTLTANSSSVSIEYKINNGSWQKYNGEIEIEDNNTKITARAKNNENQTGPEKEDTIDNIDRLAPLEFTPTITPGRTSLKITVNTEDASETNIDGKSGIKGYKFSNNNGGNWTDLQEGNVYTFEGLRENENYQIRVKAIDNAGNETEVGPFMGTTSDETQETPDGNIIFEQTPNNDTWTKGPVKLAIYSDVSGYDIEYSYDGNNFQDYTGELNIEDNNTRIYARLKNNNLSGETVEHVVENIDRLAPYDFGPSVTNTGATSITVTGSTDDWDATDKDGKSGVKYFEFSKDDGKTYEGQQEEGSYTFNGLTPGTTYKIKIKATDNAGNEKESYTYEVTTTRLPNPSTDITFTKNPSGWTRGPVSVTINNNADTYYILQYKLSNTDWDTYMDGNPITVTDNNTTIYARYKDPNSDYTTEEVQTTVDKIDRLAPDKFTPSVWEVTENTIEIRANNVDDKAATSVDGKSGIRGYIFGMSSDQGRTYYWRTEQTSNTYTFGNLSPGTTYYFKVKVIDNAGNEITSNQTSGTTTKITVPDGDDYITFDYSPRDWTNKSVTITITSTAGSQYEIQYSLNGTNWYTYNSSSKPTRSSNGPVYARLKYGSTYGTPATGNVTKIDTQKPSGTATSVTSGSSAIITVETADYESGVQSYTNATISNITKLNSSQWEVTKNGTYLFIVYDNAGNSSIFSCDVSGIKDKEVLVGDYVNYSPTGSSYINLTTDDLGVSQTVYREDLDYRVLEINGNYATLVSTATNTKIEYSSTARFYNNMVYVLNNTAKTLYSNSSLGATGRSIKQADYEEKVEDDWIYYTGGLGAEYRSVHTINQVSYPVIWAYEYGTRNAINGILNNGSWENDEQPYKISGDLVSANSVTVESNFYEVNDIEEHMKAVKTRESNNDTDFYAEALMADKNQFYYANRLISPNKNAQTGIFDVLGIGFRSGGGLSNNPTTTESLVSTSTSIKLPRSLKVIVENVPISRINLDSGDGSQSNPWGIN